MKKLVILVQVSKILFPTFGVYSVVAFFVISLQQVLQYFECTIYIIDGANYVSIFRFFSNIADFGSDVLLTIVFYIIWDELGGDEYFWFFILSFAFTGVPYLVSCVVGLYFIEKWRNETDGFLLPYLKKYDVFLIIIMIVAGFYSAVELGSSRLFYLKMFNLHTRHIDATKLKSYRFVTTVILEVSLK